MFERIKQFIHSFDLTNSRWFTKEFFRTLPLIIACILCFWGDWATLGVLKYVFGFLFAIALISHFTRKVLFPYVKGADVAKQAIQTPLGAGLVFLGFSLIICTTMLVAADFFK